MNLGFGPHGGPVTQRSELMVAIADALPFAAVQGRGPHLAFPWLGPAGSAGDAPKG